MTEIYNLKNLCRWVRRNYPQIAHLSDEDLAILPLQERWERDHNRKQQKKVADLPPPAPAPVRIVKVPPQARTPAPAHYHAPQFGGTAYQMRRIEVAQQRRIFAKQTAHRRSNTVSREVEWPLSDNRAWHGTGESGSVTNPWPGGKCSPR